MKAKVDVDMPCLTAELARCTEKRGLISDNTTVLLEGQVSSWSITLRNVGNAPASKIFLKTNLPWVNIISSDSEEVALSAVDRESLATSKCIGSTGTLMKVPIKDSHLKENGVLYPGETVQIFVQIRTSGTGKQDFYMLYKYDLFDRTSEAKRTRWLKRMYEVQVYPSLSLNASIITSSWETNEHLMAVEVRLTYSEIRSKFFF